MKTRVVAAVFDHWLVGGVPLTGIRIQDVLKNGTTEFLRLEDVQVRSYADCESCVADLSQVVIPKSKIEFVGILESRHEAPTKRHYNFTAKATTDVFVILGKCRIRGELHLPNPSNDSLYTLTCVDRFFPVTNATIEGAGIRLSVPVLFANREFVTGFYLGKPAPAESATYKQSPLPEARNRQEEELLLDLLGGVNAVMAEDVESSPTT